MASFTKRGDSWRAEVSFRGKRHTKTLPSKKAAREWAARKEALLKTYASGEMGKYKTVGDAFLKYAEEASPAKKGYKWETVRLNKFCTYDLANIRLVDLTPSDLAQWRDHRLKEIQPSSVRRELQLMNAVFTICRREWNWLSENPLEFIKMPAKARPRDRRITQIEINKIVDALGYELGEPILKARQLTAAFFLLGIETGMRLGEMCRVRESDVFLEECYIQLRDTKNGDDRKVPLSSQARAILQDVMYSDVRVSSEVAGATFRKACRAVGISNLHFHDTRHEATTRLSKKLDILELARTLGHRDLKSLMIYYNATPQEIASRLD